MEENVDQRTVSMEQSKSKEQENSNEIKGTESENVKGTPENLIDENYPVSEMTNDDKEQERNN